MRKAKTLRFEFRANEDFAVNLVGLIQCKPYSVQCTVYSGAGQCEVGLVARI